MSRSLLPLFCLVVVVSGSLWGSPARGLDAVLRGDRGPVVLLHGIRGGQRTFAGLVPVLREEGFEPIVVQWRPEDPQQNTEEVARQVVGPAVLTALSAHGWREDTPVYFVGHSAGGLLARFLVEGGALSIPPQPGLPSPSALMRQTRALVMLATPNQGAGTGIADWVCSALPRDPFWAMTCDLKTRSAFLASLPRHAPQGPVSPRYLAIGASLSLSPSFGEADEDGDGLAHGNDGAVLAESPYLPGAAFALWRSQTLGTHTRLACNNEVAKWITGFLKDPKGFPRWQASERGASARDLCRGAVAPPTWVAGEGGQGSPAPPEAPSRGSAFRQP